jgi:hypothetical protein
MLTLITSARAKSLPNWLKVSWKLRIKTRTMTMKMKMMTMKTVTALRTKTTKVERIRQLKAKEIMTRAKGRRT